MSERREKCVSLRSGKHHSWISRQGGHTLSMTQSSVTIQITPASSPSTPSWLAEVAVFAQVLNHLGLLKAIEQQVRFARARFGHYDLIDFVVVLLGYALSSEETLKAYYERLEPWASTFMACFGRNRLPDRSTLSRFLSALDREAVEALRTLFLKDLAARTPFAPPGSLSDRQGKQWWVIDVDGTKQAARQRALPTKPGLPAPHRRLTQVCAPGYRGRKRGEVVRTRTTVLQAFTHQWLGTYGGAGNGDYRGELKRALEAITWYAVALGLPQSQMLVRLDGLYGNAAPLTDIVNAGPAVIGRSKDYALLKLEAVQARLALPPDQECTHPESGASRLLYDCPDIPLAPKGPRLRLLVATHPATSSSPKVGVEREGLVYELFFTTLPQGAFSPKDVLDLYLHRGSFEPVLADEDVEQDPDRWCSFHPMGQEFWQILSQWVWNLRLELGQQAFPTAVRTTEFAPANDLTAVSDPSPIDEPASTTESSPISEPPTSSKPLPIDEPASTSEPPAPSKPPPIDEPTSTSEPSAPSKPHPIDEPASTSEPPASSKPPPIDEPTSTSEAPAPSKPPPIDEPTSTTVSLPISDPPSAGTYGPPQWARRSFTGGFPGSAFTPQPDGSLLCPANRQLFPQERRPEPNGAYRVLYAARIGDCRACQLRTQCQESSSTLRPRRVSAVIFPLTASLPDPDTPVPPLLSRSLQEVPQQAIGDPKKARGQKASSQADLLDNTLPKSPLERSPSPLPKLIEPPPIHPVLWRDWPRSQIRRHWLKVLRSETVVVSMGASPPQASMTIATEAQVFTRAERAHWRLSWKERLARNASPAFASQLTLTLHGLPISFAHHYGFPLLDRE